MFILLLSLFMMGTPLWSISIDALQINAKTVSVNIEVFKEKGTLYVPLRELEGVLELSLRYRPKYHLYECKTGNKTFQFAPFSDYIQYENTIHYLSHPPILKYNRLLVPLNALSDFLGWSASLDGTRLVLRHTQPKYPPDKGPAIPLAADAYDAVNLPRFKNEHQAWLHTPKAKINLLKHLIEHKRIQYIAVSTLANMLNLSLSREPNRIVLTGNGRSVRLVTDSTQTYVVENGKPQSAHNQAPPIIRNGQTYVPFASMIQRLGVSFSWVPETRTLALLTPIYSIQNSPENIVINASTMISPKVSRDASYIYIDIPFARLHSPQSISGTSKVPFLYAEQFTPTTVRVWGPNRYDTRLGAINKTHTQTSLAVITPLKKIQSKLSHNAYHIILPHLDSLTPKISHDDQRIIIDIPRTQSLLPSTFIDPTQAIFKRIRTSQFSQDPAITRLVVDLKSARKATISSQSDGTIISFPISAKELATIERLRSPKNSLRYKTIALDAGHGGRDPGAVGPYKSHEKTYTMDITNRLKSRLEASGATVIMTRNGDYYQSLAARASKGNRSRSHVFVSIHVNSFGKQTANGTETYYFKYKDKRLARALQSSMSRAIKRKDNGVKRANLYVLRHTQMPSALVEPVFLTHPDENQLIKSPQFRQKVADSLYEGLVRYFQAL